MIEKSFNMTNAINQKIYIQKHFNDYMNTIKDNEKIIKTHNGFKSHMKFNSISLADTGFGFSVSNFKESSKNIFFNFSF